MKKGSSSRFLTRVSCSVVCLPSTPVLLAGPNLLFYRLGLFILMRYSYLFSINMAPSMMHRAWSRQHDSVASIVDRYLHPREHSLNNVDDFLHPKEYNPKDILHPKHYSPLKELPNPKEQYNANINMSPMSTLVNPMTTVLIGPKKQRFKVNKKLLCDASPFFRERLEPQDQTRPILLWLPGESPSMFLLFVEWLNDRHNLRIYLDQIIAEAEEAGPKALQEIHWATIRLHLFASHLSLFSLQDTAMDTIQDLYLKCHWDVTPTLISYLYNKCEALPAVRMRRWAVAMVAFSLTSSSPNATGSSDPARFNDLFETLPEFAQDHAIHMQKMEQSGLDVRYKNPRQRVPANRLRNDERAYGFRECSFHSHRATVGEKRCPHERKKMMRMTTSSKDIVIELGGLASPLWRPSYRAKQEIETELDQVRMSELKPPNWRPSCMPPPLFAGENEEGDRTLKHMRSISSTMI